MKATTTTPLTGQDAIDAFHAARRPGLLRCWHYSPNGGLGNATGLDDWLTEDRLRELLDGPVRDDVEHGPQGWLDCDECRVTWDGEELILCHTPERSVHQYHHLQPAERSDWEGRAAVACYGAHYGFAWGASCEEIDSHDLPEDCAGRDLLQAVIQRADADDTLAAIGLEALGDPTDDGANWCLVDAAAWTAALARLRTVAAGDWDLDDSDTLDECVAYVLGTGPAPTAE